jgi:hypothetical protein
MNKPKLVLMRNGINERIRLMKTYIPNIDRLYPNAEVRPVPGYPNCAIIEVSSHMALTIFYPRDNDAWIDGSILFNDCMGFDPEEFDPTSEKTHKWVKDWSYPLETAQAMVNQINREAKG